MRNAALILLPLLALSACSPAAAPSQPGSSTSPAPTTSSAPTASSAPTTSSTAAAVTVTKDGAAADVEGDWAVTANADIMIYNKTALTMGLKGFGLKLEFDPAKTKRGAGGFILPGWQASEVYAATVTYKDAAGKTWGTAAVEKPPVTIDDSTSRLKGSYEFKMGQAAAQTTTQATFKITFDLPYPKAP